MAQPSRRRLLVAQYGDYLQAVRDRQQGRPETYRAQQYSMDCLDAAAGEAGEALIVCLDAPPYDVRQGNLRLVADRFVPAGRGLSYWLGARRSGARLVALAREFSPTHVIIRTPGLALTSLGPYALAHRLPVLPLRRLLRRRHLATPSAAASCRFPAQPSRHCPCGQPQHPGQPVHGRGRGPAGKDRALRLARHPPPR